LELFFGWVCFSDLPPQYKRGKFKIISQKRPLKGLPAQKVINKIIDKLAIKFTLLLALSKLTTAFGNIGAEFRGYVVPARQTYWAKLQAKMAKRTVPSR